MAVNKQDRYTSINKKTDLYSDFLINLNPHPHLKDVVRSTNEEAVKRSIRNLVMTDSYERKFHPLIGGNIKKFLFEPMSAETQKSIENAIRMTIENYEPRAKIVQLFVTPSYDNLSYSVYLMFSILNNVEPQEMHLNLYRIR